MPSLLLYLLLFSLPFQTRTLLVAGTNEYQTLFLYASDIVVGILFAWWLVRTPLTTHKAQFLVHSSILTPLLLLVLWLIASSLASINPLLGLYRTLKITEFIWIFYYLLLIDQRTVWRALGALLAGAALQSIFALGQFITQHSLGLSWLGENLLAPHLPGVAKIDAVQKIIRAYGTFPHPNVLAAFLVCCIILVVWLLMHDRINKHLRVALWLALPLYTAALFVTFSRIALITLVIVLLLWLMSTPRHYLKRIFLLSCMGLLLAATLLFPYWQHRLLLQLHNQEVAFRVLYVRTSFDIINARPITGVGLGQFTQFQEQRIKAAGLPLYANQPVHNIYLLYIAETGLVGLFLFYWFLHNLFAPLYAKLSWRQTIPYTLLPLAVFIMGSFDHFFMSFQQGELLFWVSLAFYAQFSRMNV